MGLDINAVKFLIAAQNNGVCFGKTVMLGRQNFNVQTSLIAALLERHGLPAEKFKSAGAECSFAEPLFESLGAARVDSLDNSDFEGAKYIHDLNQPVPSDWKEKFDVVYDGGTLEHVFNFPVALRNSMEMLRLGGRLFIHNCANNLCGHGFYQFSPELFYRALSLQNGFKVERMLICRVGPLGRWYEVSDPDIIRERVELITFSPVMMLIQAQRLKITQVFESAPQQSDYSAMWQAASKPGSAKPANRRSMFPHLTTLARAMRTGLEFYRRQSLSNRRFFKPTAKE
jgi:hypothetical protein